MRWFDYHHCRASTNTATSTCSTSFNAESHSSYLVANHQLFACAPGPGTASTAKL